MRLKVSWHCCKTNKLALGKGTFAGHSCSMSLIDKKTSKVDLGKVALLIHSRHHVACLSWLVVFFFTVTALVSSSPRA